MLKILGIGMPRTGTSSLAEALRILGYKTLHHAPERIDLDTVCADTFVGLYDDVDAVTDMPGAYFANEIPADKYILTIRDTDEWWESIKYHVNKQHAAVDHRRIRYADRLHTLLFGTAHPHQYLWKRRFNAWNNAAIAWRGDSTCGCHRQVLTMNISDGDKWEALCTFLGVPQPANEFPWRNKKEEVGR